MNQCCESVEGNFEQSHGVFGATVVGQYAHSRIEVSDQYVIGVDRLRNLTNGAVGHPIVLVDVRVLAQCVDGHIPGAVMLDYARLVRQENLTEGLLPTPAAVSDLLSELGATPDSFIVAYDDDTGIEAGRLLWTLEVVGHKNYALLDGGFAAWDEAEYEIADQPRVPPRSIYPAVTFGTAVVDKQMVTDAIGRESIVIVDTRSAAEFAGEDVRAARGGHIPGAVNFDWSASIDLYGDGGLRDADALRRKLQSLGITPEKEIILYCQSNRRSAHTFVVFKWLGFPHVRSYTGAWSEWGNTMTAPIALAA